MAAAEFSKFASILSAMHSQHHLSGFKIAEMEFHDSCIAEACLGEFSTYFASM